MSIACIILQLIIDIIKKFTDKGVKIKKTKENGVKNGYYACWWSFPTDEKTFFKIT